MIHKITLLTASVLLAIMACLTPRAFAQTFEATHASTLILAGGGTDPVKTLTISVAALSGATSITLPGANASGALVNDGHGTLSWSPIGVAAGTVGQFLVTLAGPTVAWQGLLINSTDFSGDGATTKLAIANTAGNDIITALNNGTPTAPIDVAAGGTGAETLTSGDLLLGNGTSAVTAGPAWNGSTLTGNVSGSAASFTGSLAGDVTGTQGATVIAPNVVTYAMMQTMTPNKLLGSGLTGTAVEEITLGTGLSFTGSTLNTVDNGTVTSIGMTVPAELEVAPASITTSGTFALSWGSEGSNTVFAGPNGSTSTPSFRYLVSPDIPAVLTLGVPGEAAGTLSLANALGNAADSTTFETSATTPTANYTYVLPAQTAAPPAGGVLAIASETGSSPNYTATLGWSTGSGLIVGMGGDVTGTSSASTVAKINGVALGSTTATSGNVLIGSGSQWVTEPISQDVSITNTGVATVSSAHGNFSVGGTLGVTGATTLSSTLGVTGLTTATGGISVPGTTGINNSSVANTVVASTTNIDATTGAEGVINIGNNGGTTAIDSSTTNIAGAVNFTGQVNIPAADLNLGLANDEFYIGNVSNIAVPQPISQDVSITNTGVATVSSAHGNFSVGGTLGVTSATTLSSTLGVTGLTTATGGISVPSTAGINNSTTANTVVASTTNIDATTGAEGVINIGNNGGTTAIDSSTTNIAGAVNFTGQVNIPAADLNLGLANDEFYIGSVGNIATPQTITQDVSITNGGVATVSSAHGNFSVGGTLGVTGLTTATGGISTPSTGGINNSSTINTVVASTTNIDATTGAEGVINIGNNGGTTAVDSSTTNIAGAVNFTGQVNIPAGDLNLGLANDKFYIGNSGGIATPQTISQDVTITNGGVATVNGSSATTFAVTNAETVGTTLGVTGLTTATGGISTPSTGGINNSSTINTVVASTTNIDATTGAEGVINIGNNGGTTAIDSSTTNIFGAVNMSGNVDFTGTVTLPAGTTVPDVGVTAQTSGTFYPTFVNTSSTNTSVALGVSGGMSFNAATDALTLGKVSTANGAIAVANGTTAFTTTLQGNSAATATATYTLPPSAPTTAGYLLASSTTGGLSWTPPPTGTITGSSFVTDAPVYATGSTALATTVTALTNGQLLIGSTSNPPVPATLGTGTGISTTVGAGTLTINNTGVTSIGNATSDNTLTIAGTGSGPWTGATTAKINLANPNTWTGQQTFSNTTSAAAPLVVTNSDAPATGPAIGATISATGVGSGTNGNIALELNATGSTISNAALYVQTGTVNIAGLNINSPVFTDGSRNLTSTGTVGVANGGTGVASPTAHDLLVAEGSTAMTPISGAAGTVLVGNGSSTDPSFSAVPTLGVPGTTAGTLTLASGAAAFSTTVQTSATTPASTYIYQLPAQPTGLPTPGNVLTIGTPTGTGPYTVPLTWTVPNSTTAVLYDQTSEQATIPISSTPATPSYLFNVGYNNTVVADSAAGAIINSINTNTTAANAPLHNADGFTVNVTATGSGTFYGNATGLIVNATAPVGGIPTGVAVTIGGDTIGPAFQLHNKTQGSFYGARSIISTVDSDLEFKETGDKYGTSILDIQNRTGSNGALFQTISNAADTGTDVIDWGFIPGNGVQSNIRLEARHKFATGVYTQNDYLRSGLNVSATAPEEFQYFFGTTGTAPTYVLDIGESATLLERGNFGIGYGDNSGGGDTVNGHPLAKLDVHSPGTYYGNSANAGSAYAGAANILLSDTGTASITAPYIGALEFQGANDGLSSFEAGAQGSKYVTYTWPTLGVTPATGMVLEINGTVGGSGTLASPWTVPLQWETVSGSSGGVNYNVATGSPQNTATSTNYLFDVAYASTSGNNNAIGALINSATTTGNGSATGLTIDASTHNAETAIGLTFGVTGGATNTDILGTSSNWSISSLGVMNLGGGTNTGDLQVNTTTAGIGATSTDGLVLSNPNGASSTVPQYSPRIRLTGHGWKTNTTAASQEADWIIENQPTVTGTAAVTSNLVFSDNENGTGYNVDASLSSGSTLTLGPTSGEEGALALGNSTNTNFTTIEAGAPTAAITYILPTTAPSANQVLQSTAPSSGVATLSWTNNGSGGLSGLTTDGVLYAASSSTAASTSAGTAGQVLTSQGSGSAPTWGLPWRSGTATIASGSSSISVTMSSAFPGSPTDYKVTATFSKTGVDWGSSSSTVPIIEISSTRTSTVFTITTDNDSGDAVVAPTGGVTIDWIAIPSN